MARKEEIFTVEKEGRDKGKTFRIVEMSAWQAEKFARRALSSIAKTGYIPDSLIEKGTAGLAEKGFAALMFSDEADDLLSELLACAKLKLPKSERDIIESDIEESSTINEIQLRAYALIMDFSMADPHQKSET